MYNVARVKSILLDCVMLEYLKNWLNLKLDDSEAVELGLIDTKLERLPYEAPAMFLELYQAEWRDRREQTVDAYRLKEAASNALLLAKEAGDSEEAWKTSYEAAQKSDTALQALLIDKLRDMLTKKGGLFTPGSSDRMLWGIGIALVLLNWSLKALTSIEKEAINERCADAMAVVMFVVLLMTFVGRLEDSHRLKALLPFVATCPDFSEEVKRLASEVGVVVSSEDNTLVSQPAVTSDSWERAKKALISLSCFSGEPVVEAADDNGLEADNNKTL